MEVAALSSHENIILGDVITHIDSQNCWTDNFNSVLSDFYFIQHVSHPHTYMDISLMYFVPVNPLLPQFVIM